MIEDLRHALRAIVKDPGYSAVAIPTLAIGVGGTVAMFSAFYAVLLAPLPYPDSHSIVVPDIISYGLWQRAFAIPRRVSER
jgi:putative ABC transport system permease protein